jgi:glycerol-3-phosphate dehydrogenase
VFCIELEMSLGLLRRSAKYTAIGAGTAATAGLAYVFVTTPTPVPPTAYRNLSPQVDRLKHLARLRTEQFDMLVVGGGATGASVAMDAASRGLKVALVEREDFSSGTSSRSTKLLHGGVRYLRDAVFNFDLKSLQLVYDALRERWHMLNCNPYLCHPLGILIPTYTYWDMLQYYVGIKMYELCAEVATLFNTGVPSAYHLSKSGCMHAYPLLREEGLKGGVYFFDGQQNDSRINLGIALTAATPNYLEGWVGAAVANYVEAVEVVKDASGRVAGLKCVDNNQADKAEPFTVRATVVVNCCGPFADGIRTKANADTSEVIVTSSGSHLILPKSYSTEQSGLLIPETRDGRVLFCLPWEGQTCIGTTDVKTDVSYLPKPTNEEVDFIVAETSNYLKVLPNDIRHDVKAAWSGLRPLVKDMSASNWQDTSKFSRDFEVIVDSETGLISVVGGKWTTCRLMAEAAVNKAIKIGSLNPKHPCRTWGLRLIGSHGGDHPDAVSLGMHLEREFNLGTDAAAYLARNYGPDAEALCDQAAASDTLLHMIPNHPFILAELKWAFSREMAQTVVDAIARRCRMAFIDPEETRKVLPQLVDRIGEWQQWSIQRRLKELEMFLDTMSYKAPDFVPMEKVATVKDPKKD